MPSFFRRRRLPGSLGGELGDMQSSMKRRLKQLEGLQELENRGYRVSDNSVFLDKKAPDAKKMDDALRRLRELRGKDFGTNGNRDDLEQVSRELDGMTAAELDALVTKASPKNLAFYNQLLTNTDDSAWNPFTTTVCPRASVGTWGL